MRTIVLTPAGIQPASTAPSIKLARALRLSFGKAKSIVKFIASRWADILAFISAASAYVSFIAITGTDTTAWRLAFAASAMIFLSCLGAYILKKGGRA